MIRPTGPLVIAAVLAASPLALAPAAAPAGDAPIARARETLVPFKRALKRALTDGMRDGPVHAIEACHTEAPGI